jgi:PKD repeat protein
MIYCERASIAMINHYYLGNLSQDRISYYIKGEFYRKFNKPPETDLGHGWGFDYIQAEQALSWALDNATITHQTGKPSYDQIVQWINSGRPVMITVGGHTRVIDGYDGQYMHVIDPAYGSESRILYDNLDMYQIGIPPTNATARNDEQSIWKDSDNDGIVDFDEINRFHTNPYSNDTDNDGIPDKIEIRSYTFLSNDSFDSEDVRKPDTDGDGLRAEIDFDSDNGGTPDGLEDLNKNGKLDPGETDPFNATDDPYFPPPVAKFEYSPEKSTVNETITFNATASYSPKGNITSYQWNFDDGNVTTVTQPLINHTYNQPGKYNVTLKVTDNNTLRNTTSKMITVYYKTDLNKDGTVDILDIAIVAKAYGTRPGDKNWNSIADLDKSGEIDIIDIAKVARDYGKTIT